MDFLPEDCVGHIFSFASPPDACRMCLVSSAVQCMVESDSVWARFLPYDYQDIVSRLDSPLEFSSMKDLFFKLCQSRLIDGGQKVSTYIGEISKCIFSDHHLIIDVVAQVFWLDRRTAKKCYILSARELSITWASNPLYWSWKPLNGSRFAEVAELRTICWLEIRGSIAAPALSPKSTYEVYLVAQFANRAFGLNISPSGVTTFEVGNKHHPHQTRCLRGSNQPTLEYVCYSSSTKVLRSRGCGERNQNARARGDGWIEIKLGEFYNYGLDPSDDQEARMSLIEVKGVYLKGGLIVEGIEIRVKENERGS
uniref:F-box domain-containing protein n=1 Tax=Kalanchoe fedtschenkoi TaxID=63787 RepID=A0A7N0RHG7_KALFE